MPSLRLHGLVAATHTPFAADGTLHLPAVERQARHLEQWKVRWVFVGGTTGESHSLTTDERLQLARRWLDVTHGSSMQIVVHVGSNCLAESRQLAAAAQADGAAAIAALAPSYFKPRSIETLVDCCADMAAAAPETPFYYYDIPALTGVSLPAHEFLESASPRIPTLAGIKFTNSDLMSYQLCLHCRDGAFDIPYGSDEWLLAALALGGRGAVGSSYNFAAPIYQRLITAFDQGDLEAARREQFRSVRLIQTLARYGYLPAAKAVMDMLDVPVGDPRLPLAKLGADQVRTLRMELEQLGFFDWLR